MPHKHTRKGAQDGSSFNLAPSSTARPLPAYTKATLFESDSKRKSKKRKSQHIEGYGADDTPRAFARLMQSQPSKKVRPSLDNGDAPRTKRAKTAGKEHVQTQPEAIAHEAPKILPGERLADYSARVDQAIPVAGLARKGKVHIEGVKERRTKKEKKMHKMYAEWREEDAKVKARQEELAEQAEEDKAERLAEYNGQDIILPGTTKKQRAIGEVGSMDEDPWAVLNQKRDAPRGLHDVVQAPPDLKVVPKERFKVRNGARVDVANIPVSAGSLKKREELGEARREVIERYRAMMKANKG